ncbi:MAG: TadE/TadG family type IV pilus assembly protein [Xanthobacteraceae bacterium]
MLPSEPRRIDPRRALRRLRRDRRGSAAIEFAIVAPLFFGLLFVIFELGLAFFADQVLENGLQQSARQMFTHQAYDTNLTKEAFAEDLCGRVKLLMSCSKLRVNVSVTSDGETISFLSPVDADGKFVDNFTYRNPQPRDTVVVSAFYPWPAVIVGLGFNIANFGGANGGERLLTSTAAFRVEPK